MKNLSKNGFGLVETLVGVAVFTLIALSSYNGFIQILKGVKILEIKNSAANLANEQIEVIRNLPYNDVGIVNGIPSGKIPREQNQVRGGVTFNIVSSIQNVDDPFDGTIDGNPEDTSPADYRLVTLTLSCENCPFTQEMQFHTRVAPQALETGTQNGALFVRVFDANGNAIQGADVHIENNSESPAIIIDDTTNIDGDLKLFDVPPGLEAYEITVTKDGYSTEQTYTSGEAENPLPDRPNVNVLAGEVTHASFAIDKLSQLIIKTRTADCSIVPDVEFNIQSSKEIGYQIPKYEDDLQTGSNGLIGIDDVEWDNYFISLENSTHDLYGANTVLPIHLLPDSERYIDFIVGSKRPNALLVQIRDAETDLPLSGAVVTLSSGGYEEIVTTGNGFINQTDWSGGAGQSQYTDTDRFYSTDNNIDYGSVEGQVTLSSFAGTYSPSGYIESSYIDTGAETNFHNLSWSLADQPENTVSKFQIATILEFPELPELPVWNFVGPDGLDTSYYSIPGENIPSSHDGDRYLKYKMYLETTDPLSTPLVSDVNFTYSTECVPPGQVMFTDLEEGIYILTVERDGYQSFEIDNLYINEEWDMFEVIMTP